MTEKNNNRNFIREILKNYQFNLYYIQKWPPIREILSPLPCHNYKIYSMTHAQWMNLKLFTNFYFLYIFYNSHIYHLYLFYFNRLHFIDKKASSTSLTCSS